MNESRTSTMLQRIPVILAVTAASYGLEMPRSVARTQPGEQLSGYTRASAPRTPARQVAQRSARRELQAA